MSAKHLRDSLLNAVSSLAELDAFCDRYGEMPLNGSPADLESFEAKFRRKANEYGMNLDIAEAYLISMRGRDSSPPPTRDSRPLFGTIDDTGIEGVLLPNQA